MRNVFLDYLFSQGYLVADDRSKDTDPVHVAAALVALAELANIRVTSHPELANLNMLRDAKRNLGEDVPLPFYRSFPNSVRELSPDVRALDQFLHYARSYGMGFFDEPGHSLFERHYERAAFDEDVMPKDYAIVDEREAEKILAHAIEGFLKSTRPLSDANYQLLRAYVYYYHDLPSNSCANKDAAVRLLIDSRDLSFVRLIELPDVIRLVEWLLELRYNFDSRWSIRKLNLRNKDRKLITQVLDALFERGHCNVDACLEKKRAWNGLLHHLHYRPRNAEAQEFCLAIRNKDRRSAYSDMELCLARHDVRGAADALRARKGAGAVLRHLDHLLSYCESDDDVAYVVGKCDTRNKILLIQLLLKFGSRSFVDDYLGRRTFTFVRFGKLCTHKETISEFMNGKILLSDDINEQVHAMIRTRLTNVCRGTLGKVYASEDLRNATLPLQEGASMGGFGTLPRGTRIPMPAGKKIRAFTYWKLVNDIDLSCIALNERGYIQREFSWRTTPWRFPEGLVFSGDQTSGYHGGSEYFDVSPSDVSHEYPDWRYLLLCNNVYTRTTFDRCECRAGYMLRDEKDSGEIFEPATVQTSFVINCKSRMACLFALDLQENAFVWLNLAKQSTAGVAGTCDMSFVVPYLLTTKIMSLYDFAHLLATEVVATPEEADVVFSDEPFQLRDDQEQIRSRNTARILELINEPHANTQHERGIQ